MWLPRISNLSVLCSLFLLAGIASPNSVVFAQDLSKTIFPITKVKLLGPGAEMEFATGFCLSEDCRFVGTNYHVAMMAQLRKIRGDKIIHSYLATAPEDEGATVNGAFLANPMKYNLGRDIAVYELRYPLPHYHGITLSLNDLQLGQEVDIYTYPKESGSPIRRLEKFHGAFKGESTGGLLAFDYSPSDGKSFRTGASGGLVVDCKSQQVVGILSGVARDGERVAMAVPMESLANFLSKVQPWLAESLFPSAIEGTLSPVSSDFYPKFTPPPSIGALQARSNEPAEIMALREKAQRLADSMRNFVAVQTLAWGSGARSAPAAVAAYEIRVQEGFQRFREHPDGKEELRNVPFPPINTVVVPGGEWSELPQMVGTELRLRIHQAADATVDGRIVRVFQFRAESEDGICTFKSVRDFGFFSTGKIISVPCYGEVWTTEDFNILRISEHLELTGDWKDYESVVTYGWLHRTGEALQRAPLTISTRAVFKKKMYWCRGLFTNYRVFSSRANLVASH